MKLIDLHCDTAYRIHAERALLSENKLHISLKNITKYENYAQMMAIYIDKRLTDEEGFNRFHEIYGYLCAELAENRDKIALITDGRELPALWDSGRSAALLSVEDARLLAGRLERLDTLHGMGVRSLVLMWGGESCIGGSHESTSGLTGFGREVTRRCFSLGIIPDISHASERGASEIIATALECGKPVIASHSNSYSVYPHSRNLRDHHFASLREMGGLVGISLCRSHLAPGDVAAAEDVIRHIDRYMSLGGEDCVALGCDLDGTDLPDGITDVSDLDKLYDRLGRLGYSRIAIERIFWRNAANFIEKNVR